MKLRRFLVQTGLTLLALLVLLNSPLGGVTRRTLIAVSAAPISYLGSSGRSVHGFFNAFYEIGTLRRENDRLAQELLNLQVDRSQINELLNENKLLKKELGFIEKEGGQELIPARIIGRDPVTFLDYVMVDQGASNGVAVGQPVVSNGVLVGKVREASEHQAKVTLVTSKDSIVQAMLQSSRSKGVLRGGVSGLVLEDISQDAEFTVGENVVTSGLGGSIKEGILIGRARSTRGTESTIFKTITVEPSADLSKLEIVFIVKGPK